MIEGGFNGLRKPIDIMDNNQMVKKESLEYWARETPDNIYPSVCARIPKGNL